MSHRMAVDDKKGSNQVRQQLSSALSRGGWGGCEHNLFQTAYVSQFPQDCILIDHDLHIFKMMARRYDLC